MGPRRTKTTDADGFAGKDNKAAGAKARAMVTCEATGCSRQCPAKPVFEHNAPGKPKAGRYKCLECSAEYKWAAAKVALDKFAARSGAKSGAKGGQKPAAPQPNRVESDLRKQLAAKSKELDDAKAKLVAKPAEDAPDAGASPEDKAQHQAISEEIAVLMGIPENARHHVPDWQARLDEQRRLRGLLGAARRAALPIDEQVSKQETFLADKQKAHDKAKVAFADSEEELAALQLRMADEALKVANAAAIVESADLELKTLKHQAAAAAAVIAGAPAAAAHDPSAFAARVDTLEIVLSRFVHGGQVAASAQAGGLDPAAPARECQELLTELRTQVKAFRDVAQARPVPADAPGDSLGTAAAAASGSVPSNAAVVDTGAFMDLDDDAVDHLVAQRLAKRSKKD